MKILILMTLVTLISCGRDAEKIYAPKNFFDYENDFSSFGTRGSALDNFYNKEHNPIMRDASVIVYPKDEDMEGFSFKSDPNRKNAWDAAFDKLNSPVSSTNQNNRYNPEFAKRLKRSFGFNQNMNGQKTVKHMVNWINTAAMIRDDAHRDRGESYFTVKRLTPVVDLAIDQNKATEKSIVKSFVCHYVNRVSGIFQCKTEAFVDGGNSSRKKRPRKCKDIDKYSFTLDTPQDQAAFDVRFNQAKADCTTEKDRFDRDVKPLVDKLRTAEGVVESYHKLREAYKSVVLDILENAEKFSTAGYIGALSTDDKDFSCMGSTTVDSKSMLSFKNDKKEVDEFELCMNFGSWIKEGEKIKEKLFSLKNGGIQNLDLYKEGDILTLKFDLIYRDKDLTDGDGSLLIRAKLALTENEQDPYMGLRFVGKTKVYYADGQVRDGVMKFEFDRKM